MPDAKHVLIVDDAPEARSFLSAVLGDNGYSHEVVSSVAEADQAIATRMPDLILLDIMMPGGNGILFFKKLKKDPRRADIRVVFITGASAETGVDIASGEEQPTEAYSEQFDRAVGGRIHAHLSRIEPDGILEKPVDPEALIEVIGQLL